MIPGKGQAVTLGVIADDSAGEALLDSPPAAFLRLLARTMADGLGPVSLLSVLKHPMAGLGVSRPECRRLARQFERRFLRGPAPAAGDAAACARVGTAVGPTSDLRVSP